MTEVRKPGSHGKLASMLLFFQLEKLERLVINILSIFRIFIFFPRNGSKFNQLCIETSMMLCF